MARKPYDNPYYNNPFDDAASPVIDPAPTFDADPEAAFDAVKEAPLPKSADPAAQPKDTRSILERLRQAKVHVDAERNAAAPETAADPASAAGAAAAAYQEKSTQAECPRCAESEKSRLLAMADLDNARKRLAREKEEFLKFAGESVIADILPALDNLDLALAYAPQGAECRNFVVGVDMTRKLLLDALAKHGLEQVGVLGESFDPARHEAVEMQQHPEFASGQVCSLMNKGYRLRDRLIRPARVKVCKND